MWNPELAYDVPLYELDLVACLNMSIGLDLYPLSEIIDGN